MPEELTNDDYVMTFHGNKFHIHGSDPREVDIKDIAHALSRVNRFTGHTTRPYSVAEHSIHVMNICRSMFGDHPEMLLCALLHDASEAYLADISSPMKQFLPDYKALEQNISSRIMARFNLPLAKWHSEIKHADWIALFTEALDLQPNGRHAEWKHWDSYGTEAIKRLERYGVSCMTPNQARNAFYREFTNLIARLEGADLVNWRGSPRYA